MIDYHYVWSDLIYWNSTIGKQLGVPELLAETRSSGLRLEELAYQKLGPIIRTGLDGNLNLLNGILPDNFFTLPQSEAIMSFVKTYQEKVEQKQEPFLRLANHLVDNFPPMFCLSSLYPALVALYLLERPRFLPGTNPSNLELALASPREKYL